MAKASLAAVLSQIYPPMSKTNPDAFLFLHLHLQSLRVRRAGYASASVEGRISVEYFDPSPEEQARKYAFKCHRQTIEGGDLVWPVNALAFNPT